MRYEDYVSVASMDGLFDRDVEHLLHSINHREKCWFNSHDWTDSYLHWRGPISPSDARYDKFGDAIGFAGRSGFGDPLRFCKRCKVIDCRHYIPDEPAKYRVPRSAYRYLLYSVATCVRCGVRLRTCQGALNEPSEVAVRIVEEMAAELKFDLNNCPSGFVIELPVQASFIAERSEEEAREHVRQALTTGRVAC